MNEERMNVSHQKRVAFYTLGCKVNLYDTESVAALFKKKGYKVVGFDDEADIYVINTCSVTNTGAHKSRQIIHRAHRKNPQALVVVMGCYSQYASEQISRMEEVDVVVGTGNRKGIVELVERALSENRRINAVDQDIFKIKEYEELPVSDFPNRTRAYLKIQDGCNHFCSYCQIPLVRGRSRSRLPEKVKEQVKALAGQGFKEVVLTGVHIGDYGKDLDVSMDLATIIKEIHDTPGLHRIRISSIDPLEVTDSLIECMAELPKVGHHLHISLQSGDDGILKLMRRNYTGKDFADIIDRVRKAVKDISITTDVITGFPQETDEAHGNTLDFCRQMAFSKIHVFPFSQRAGTTAQRLPGKVSNQVKTERAASLLQLSDELALAFNKRFLGREMEVLVEEAASLTGNGLTDNYIRVSFPSTGLKQGDLCLVKLVEVHTDHMTGQIVG
jgi:threonylcarbamoyladenosine tRNA methylthiotransferase MtaB